jgi:Rrf2 family protein
MIKLNRTTEYGLIALRHINKKGTSQPAGITSAREIADVYGLPFEITAKTLQRLKEKGVIQSSQGSKGGYTMERTLESITLSEFIEMMEGPASVVPCAGGTDSQLHAGCEYRGKCEIRGVMENLNDRLQGFLSGIRLAELS